MWEKQHNDWEDYPILHKPIPEWNWGHCKNDTFWKRKIFTDENRQKVSASQKLIYAPCWPFRLASPPTPVLTVDRRHRDFLWGRSQVCTIVRISSYDNPTLISHVWGSATVVVWPGGWKISNIHPLHIQQWSDSWIGLRNLLKEIRIQLTWKFYLSQMKIRHGRGKCINSDQMDRQSQTDLGENPTYPPSSVQ